jgi:conjugative transfer pilus assembly protein TraH
MNKSAKKIIAALMIVSLAMPRAFASQLDNALGGMFSNLTGAGTVKTPDRTAFTGGSLTLRSPVSPINLVTFDPPRLNAGCGGLDIYGGSFSFINADQLVALFRKVAANAIGLAFQAAIAAINPTLKQLMDEFQNKIADLNSQLKNTCMVAQTIMGKDGLDASKSISQWTNSAVGAVKGVFSDTADGVAQTTNSPSTTANQTASLSDLSGNAVWKAINNPQNGAQGLGVLFTDPASAISMGTSEAQEANEILMSMTGYYVIGEKNNGVDASGAELGAGYIPTGVALVDINDIREGGTLTKYVCNEPYQDDSNAGCLTTATQQFNFTGMKGYVRDLLLGGQTTAVDIVSAMASQPVTALSDKQNLLLQATSVPVMSLISKVGFDQNAQRAVLSSIVPIVAENMLYRYMSAMTKVLNQINVNPTAQIPDFVKERIKYLNNQAEILASKQVDQLNQLNNVAAFTDRVRQGNIATFYVSGAK